VRKSGKKVLSMKLIGDDRDIQSEVVATSDRGGEKPEM